MNKCCLQFLVTCKSIAITNHIARENVKSTIVKVNYSGIIQAGFASPWATLDQHLNVCTCFCTNKQDLIEFSRSRNYSLKINMANLNLPLLRFLSQLKIFLRTKRRKWMKNQMNIGITEIFLVKWVFWGMTCTVMWLEWHLLTVTLFPPHGWHF